jgi:RNA polymerase sigma-70 factor, ECF subfamily
MAIAGVSDEPRAPREARTPERDRAFQGELVKLIPHLRAFARTLTGDPTAADYLAQDAMIKAWDARESFQIGTNMKAWTFMILRNQFYSEKRRSWRQIQLDQEAAERTLVAIDNPADPIALDELRLGLKMLPPEQREALILVGAGGFAYEEAAAICNCAVGTVKSRVSRARRALQALLDDGAYDRDGGGASDAMFQILAESERLSTQR